jgi:6-phosphogluconolactonase/glucosamine-6-phosphate isomerase/deaminase
MNIVHSADPAQGIEAMATRISDALNAGRKVLWLVCGGSNISVAAKAMERIRVRTVAEAMSLLTVGLTDERYGSVGHKDSNWQQLVDMHANLAKVSLMPVLIGKSLEATVDEYAKNFEMKVKSLRAANGIVVAMFGIGADGHIAGILPNTEAAESEQLVAGYKAGPYIRITLTFKALEMIDTAYAFVFSGGSTTKEITMQKLVHEDADLDEQPAQILKKLGEAVLYTDLTLV